ncbi:centrosomal protein of 170 kDa protein B isoform X4 [Hippocampus zosterae]|uniref:centrosomal protein of 170 kDa protein B isoform X4 n=1 Tax=Hippocampus zosterae TaxID=109293 RepID=UPI00223E2829|nr:centrosomal protein of 170 kDa protein B isoform X4 [Hippocampus zosterae]
MSVTSWFLISSSGTRHRLPREMIFVGRDDCELMLQSRSVDKQHAVINYDPNADEHMVKDLGSLNGTFVNDLRIPDQTYITLKLSDVIRFGYDAHVYILEKSQHKVPEEALKHEKYTSQLQLGLKALEARVKDKQHVRSPEKSKEAVSNVKLPQKSERKALSLTVSTDKPISKPTPLYGQPSWWGEDEDPATKIHNRSGKATDLQTSESVQEVSRYALGGSLSEKQAKSIFSYRQEPSYFEIPRKEFQQRLSKKPELQLQEVPTKDTQDPSDHVPSTPTPPVVQSHASFTIEFDECTPGKMKIKDHVTKFSFRQQRKPPATEAVTTPTEVMSPECKVADWLVQSTANMTRRRSQGENIFSDINDPSLLMKTKANHYENVADIGLEDLTINEQSLLQSQTPTGYPQSSPRPQRASPPQRFTDSEQPSSYSPPQSQSGTGKADPHRAFVIEFYDGHSDDNPRRKRSQTPPSEPSNLRNQLEKARKSTSPAGEKQVCRTPPSQRYTIPLKGPASTDSPRPGSLRREKTEERLCTGFSSRSSSAISGRPFSSVGRRSKLAKEFKAEWLKQTQQTSSSSEDIKTFSLPTKPETETSEVSLPDQTLTSPDGVDPSLLPKTSSPIHQPVPLEVPKMPLVCQNGDAKVTHGGPRNVEEDTLSDAGTYTIEADDPDKELEEARNKIEKVFGVVENPEGTNHSEADTSATFRPLIVEGRELHRQSNSEKVETAGALIQGAPKWMSCWASLVDVETGPSSGHFERSSRMELSGGARTAIASKLVQNNDFGSEDSRARRIVAEKSDVPVPSIQIQHDPHLTFNVEESSLVATSSHDGVQRLSVQDDVEPDSLSDASKSDDGSVVEQRRRPPSITEKTTNEDEVRQSDKSKTFYSELEDDTPETEYGASQLPDDTLEKTEKKRSTKTFSTATLTKRRGSQESGKARPPMSASILVQDTPSSESTSASSFVRQESFTKEEPSSARLPNISSLGDPEPDLFQRTCSQDTHSYLKETEDVLAVLEAKIQAGQSETTPSPIPDSLSGESDVDSSSTLSQQSNRLRSNPLTKKPPLSGLQRETSSPSLSSHYSTHRLEKSEPLRGPTGLRRSIGKSGSVDLSDDLQSSNVKSSRVTQNSSRVNSFSAPRPTRASMLRRARLGEASDNETTETDRLSKEAANVPTKETKKLSRWDMLAMPRRRTSSFHTPSDTENSSAPQWAGKSTALPSRSTESGSISGYKASSLGPKPGEKPLKTSLAKTLITRGRSSSAKYASSTASSRRRQKGCGYTSTSDEEYDSNQNTPKHKRSQPSSASQSPHRIARSRPMPLLRPNPCNKDSEENQDGESLSNWSTHSAEIARLSQDLAKDLAILAREIHDVTGEGGPPNLTAERSAPVSAVTAHEKLVQRIPEMGLNYQRVPPSSSSTAESSLPSSDPDLNSTLQPHSREEVTVEDPMLNPVLQVIMAIRENTEQLSEKIKALFYDRMDLWEQIEAEVNTDSDGLVVKASNKDITSILKELRRVQRQVEIINTVMGPSWQPDARSSEPEVTSSLAGRVSRAAASRDWRTVHSVSKRGGGQRPGESVRRAAVTPEDLREGRLV